LLDALRSDGLLVDDTKEKAEILNRQYFSVFTPENTDEQLPPRKWWLGVVQILLQIVLISVLVFGLVQWLLLDQDF
jgi:hypothetical protein